MGAFAGQIAVVTGASQGIGKAIALGLAKQGATTCLVARTPETLEAVVKSGSAVADQLHTYPGDLTQDEEIQRLAASLRRDFGHVDVLVHSAGIIHLGPLEKAPVVELDAQYRANVRAPYALTQALLPMIKSRRGQIVFVNSTAGLTARANVGQYCATQFALKAIADSLRDEVNTDGVRVLTIHPGRTATPRQARIHAYEGKQYLPDRLMQPEDVATMVITALSLPRTMEITSISMRPMQKPLQP